MTHRLAWTVLTMLLVATGCGGHENAASLARAAVCFGAEPLGGRPLVVPGGASADAHRVGGLRWAVHEGCERLVIDLVANDGAAARVVGHVRIEAHPELGVVRITLEDVLAAHPKATDVAFDGVIHRAYAVRAADGGLYVDVHLGGVAEIAATVLESPGRVVIDARPIEGSAAPPAAADRHVVVLAPRAGPIAYPLTVTGYARTFESNVVARLVQDGRVVFETFTTATAWLEAWGEYAITIDDGPAGSLELQVGEYSARDGAWEGVVVEVAAPND